MLLVPDQIQPCFFPFFTLVLTLTCLTSFGGHKYALAQFPGWQGPEGPFIGPNPKYPSDSEFPLSTESSDYPDDVQIRNVFSDTGLDQTLLVAISEFDHIYRYELFCNRLECISEQFPADFFKRLERSRKWYRDFLARCHALYMEKARGIVYILTDTAQPPISCTYFTAMIFHLKRIQAVTKIILVSAEDWDDQLVYWERKDDGNKDPPEKPDRFEVHPLTTVGGGGFSIGGLIGTSEGPAVDFLKKTTFDPVVHLLFGNDYTPDWPSEVETDPVLSTTASLPSSDDQLIGSASVETSETDKVPLKTDDQGAVGENLDARNVFRRRRRPFLPRDSGNCMDWMEEWDFSSNPSPPDAVLHVTSPDPKTANLAQEDWNPERLLAPFDVKEDVVTLLVLQHAKTAPNPDFVLDISISYQGKTIYNKAGVNAPPNEKIKVPIPFEDAKLPPDSLIVSAKFSWPIFLSTGENNADPLTIQYGDPLMFSQVTGGSRTFDSSNTNICHTNEWANSQREIKCSIIVAH